MGRCESKCATVMVEAMVWRDAFVGTPEGSKA